MINIRNDLMMRGININDSIFVNTIMSSVPNTFKPMINALAIFSVKSDKKLNPSKLISTTLVPTESDGPVAGCLFLLICSHHCYTYLLHSNFFEGGNLS